MAVNLFDANFYRAANPDLAVAGLTTDAQVFSHFQNYGLSEGRAFSTFVNLNFYRSSNSDLSSFNNKQLLDHLQIYGVCEDRRFSPFVSLDFYRQANSDLSAFSSEQAFEHLQTYGLSEGRQFSSLINLNYYRQVNSDLSKFNNAQALQHLETYGLSEGRQFSQTFSINYYKSHYADLVAAKLSNSQLLEHYELFGINEGRHGNTYQQGKILAGFYPNSEHDLVNHGGKTMANLSYANFYLGGASYWKTSDMQNIDSSLSAAMSDRNLNNIMSQYFPGQQITSNFLESRVVEASVPNHVSQPDIETIIGALGKKEAFKGYDLSSTVFDFMLPSGTTLSQGDSYSQKGLGGYHGSVNFTDSGGTQKTAYYAISVYSQNDRYLGLTNGIAVFKQPWKNVVAIAYHELNETRTDADVEEVNRTGNQQLLGWYSDKGGEVGDYPITEAGSNLGAVIREVPLANGESVPIQYMYSNRVHGIEDPNTITTIA